LQAFNFSRRERDLFDEAGEFALPDLEGAHHRLASLYIDDIILV
jgi:hypothetical protein